MLHPKHLYVLRDYVHWFCTQRWCTLKKKWIIEQSVARNNKKKASTCPSVVSSCSHWPWKSHFLPGNLLPIYTSCDYPSHVSPCSLLPFYSYFCRFLPELFDTSPIPPSLLVSLPGGRGGGGHCFAQTKMLLLSGNYRQRLITTLGSNDAALNEIFIKDPSASN